MTGGVVRDIRTGRTLGRTRDLSETFVRQLQALLLKGEPFYVVYGRCQHNDVRRLVDQLHELEGFPTVYDAQMPSDLLWIFEGEPEELGFAS